MARCSQESGAFVKGYFTLLAKSKMECAYSRSRDTGGGFSDSYKLLPRRHATSDGIEVYRQRATELTRL